VLHPEAAFLAGYAAVLVGVAVGLDALGRRAVDPWSSNVLAASRPPTAEQPDDPASWLHADVPAFHVGISAVALGAALALTAVNAVRHHQPFDLLVQFALLAVISMTAYRLVNRHRLPASPQRDGPSLPGEVGSGSSVHARGR